MPCCSPCPGMTGWLTVTPPTPSTPAQIMHPTHPHRRLCGGLARHPQINRPPAQIMHPTLTGAFVVVKHAALMTSTLLSKVLAAPNVKVRLAVDGRVMGLGERVAASGGGCK